MPQPPSKTFLQKMFLRKMPTTSLWKSVLLIQSMEAPNPRVLDKGDEQKDVAKTVKMQKPT